MISFKNVQRHDIDNNDSKNIHNVNYNKNNSNNKINKHINIIAVT